MREAFDEFGSFLKRLVVRVDLVVLGLATGNGVLLVGIAALVNEDELWRLLLLVREDDVYTSVLANLSSGLLTQELVVKGIDINSREPAGRMSTENAHDITTGLHAVLTVTSVDLVSGRAIAALRSHDAGLVEALKLGKSLTLAQVACQVVGVCLGVRAAVLAGSVSSGHGHSSSEVLKLVDTLLDPVRRSDNVDFLAVVRARGQNQTAASLLQEIVKRATTVSNKELVAAAFDGALVNSQSLAELLHATLELSLCLLGSNTLSRNLNGEVGL